MKTKSDATVSYFILLARINQQPPVHHDDRIVSEQQTLVHWVPVP